MSSFLSRSLSATILAAGLAAGGVAHAGIIITIGDSPLEDSVRLRYVMGDPCDWEEEEGEGGTSSGAPKSDPGYSPNGQPTMSRTCRSTATGNPVACPVPSSPSVDASGLPSEWRCYAIAPGVFYCDAPIFGMAPLGDDEIEDTENETEAEADDESIEVVGCQGGSSVAWPLALLGLGALALRRRRVRAG
jgi:MYXO-CTERM domain-containing protein